MGDHLDDEERAVVARDKVKTTGPQGKALETSKPAVIITLVTSWSWRSWDMQIQMDGACPYINIDMLIGIDDTDSPQGMCTTYLGAVLVRRLIREHMRVSEARLVRLNPNVTFKTRGNAAVMLDVEGDPDRAFAIACALVEELADFSCENTNPGVVVTERRPDPAFYRKAVTDFCTIEEAVAILEEAGARYRGWKIRRGLIGATAAVASELADTLPRSLYTVSRRGSARPARLTGGTCLKQRLQPSRTHGTPWISSTMLLCVYRTRPTRSCSASGERARNG